jgi:hypothetical protein
LVSDQSRFNGFQAFRIVDVRALRPNPGNPDIGQIGRVVSVAAGKLSLLEIGPSAVWDETPTQYSLKQITRVDFGGAYEDALHIVGGNPIVRPS